MATIHQKNTGARLEAKSGVGDPMDQGTDAEALRRRPIWRTIAAIGAQIPEETWSTVPDDASMHYKHYLYGVPKKQP